MKGIRIRNINDPFYLRELIRVVPLERMHAILAYGVMMEDAVMQVGVDKKGFCGFDRCQRTTLSYRIEPLQVPNLQVHVALIRMEVTTRNTIRIHQSH